MTDPTPPPNADLWRAARGCGLLVAALGFGVGALIDLWWVIIFVEISVNASQYGEYGGLELLPATVLAGIALPAQLFAVIVGVAEANRRIWPDFPPGPRDGQAGLIVSVLALVALGLPALVMAVAAVARPLVPYDAPLSETLWYVAEPMTVVWGPMWGIGVLLAGLGFGMFDRYLPLLLLLGWPCMALLYAVSWS